MYPYPIHFLGLELSIWNAAFVVSAAVGYAVLRVSAQGQTRIGLLGLRYLVSLYIAVLGAQLFAYAFDANTSLHPPPGTSYAEHYLNPLAGPKTLYGAIVLAPLAVGIAALGSRLPLGRALDVWTPCLFVVMAGARSGCLLQGCCHGVRSDAFGISFPTGSPVYWKQMAQGLIADGASALPVVPTQAIEAVFLAAVAAVVMQTRAAPDAAVSRAGERFALAVAAYSVFRFAIEMVRGDEERGIYGALAASQWISLVVLVVTLAVLVRRARLRAGRQMAGVPRPV